MCVCTSTLAPLCRSRCCQCCWNRSFSLFLPAALLARRHIQSFNILCTVSHSQLSYSATRCTQNTELTLPDRSHCMYVPNLHTLVCQHIHKLVMYVYLYVCIYSRTHSHTESRSLFRRSLVRLFVRSSVRSFVRSFVCSAASPTIATILTHTALCAVIYT